MLFVVAFNLIFIFVIDRVFGLFYPAYPTYLNKQTYSWDSYESNYRNYFTDRRVGPDGKTYYTVDRSKEFERKYLGREKELPKNSIQIIAIGDSFTFGQGVRLEDTYVKRLEKINSKTKIFGINLGRGGDNIEGVFEQFSSQISNYKPNIVIYGYVLNDPIIDLNHGAEITNLDINNKLNTTYDNGLNWDLINLRVPAIRSLRTGFWKLGEYSRIVEFFQATLEKNRLSENTVKYYNDLHDPLKNAKGLEQTFEKINRIKQIVESSGSKFVVIIFPILFDTDKNYPFQGAHDLVSMNLKKLGIPSIDLAPAYSKYKAEELWVHPVDQHPNDLAQKIAADQIEAWLKENTNLIEKY